MTKRLQVLLDDEELREFQAIAKRQHLTLAEWVRQALRAATRGEPRRDASAKLRLIRDAVGGSAPSPDIDQMLAEIEQGYHDPGAP